MQFSWIHYSCSGMVKMLLESGANRSDNSSHDHTYKVILDPNKSTMLVLLTVWKVSNLQHYLFLHEMFFCIKLNS